MKLPALARRRAIVVPTLFGWLVLLLAGFAIALTAAAHLYSFLAPSDPIGGRVLIVEGWMIAAELEQAAELSRSGHYERLITTGGPIETGFDLDQGSTYAERARNHMIRYGIPESRVIAVPSPRSTEDRTYHNAIRVREWVLNSDLEPDSLDVVSSGPHSRRSWLVYRLAFGPRFRVGILAATPTTYDSESWWRTSAGAREVLGEAIAWLWTKLFFHPDTSR